MQKNTIGWIRFFFFCVLCAALPVAGSAVASDLPFGDGTPAPAAPTQPEKKTPVVNPSSGTRGGNNNASPTGANALNGDWLFVSPKGGSGDRGSLRIDLNRKKLAFMMAGREEDSVIVQNVKKIADGHFLLTLRKPDNRDTQSFNMALKNANTLEMWMGKNKNDKLVFRRKR